jgi:cytoplasmic iron level regulating protein YaaA (DUF328/UPF0246 family)
MGSSLISKTAARRLLIMSEAVSKRRLPKEPIPALERYDGVFFKVVRRLKREGKLKGVDIVIVSQEYGIIGPNDEVPYYDSKSKDFGSRIELTKDEVEKLRKENLVKLASIIKEMHYSEIIVNVGKAYLKLIEGLEDIASVKTLQVEGRSLGLKAKKLREIMI